LSPEAKRFVGVRLCMPMSWLCMVQMHDSS
jgi:hypothetical protein